MQEKIRVTTGIPGLDTVLNGGLLKGGTYIIMGHPGAGKTIMGNQMAFHHVANGGKAVYVTLLAESHSRMLMHLEDMSFLDEDVIGEDLTYLSAYSILEDEGLTGLLNMLLKTLQYSQASLLVIDGLVSASVAAKTPTEFKKFIHGLQVRVESLDCTAVLLTSPGPPQSPNTEHTMVDGVVELTDELVSLRHLRELSVLKFRGSQNLRGKHTLDISDDGITIYPRIETRYAEMVSTADAQEERTAFGIESLDALLHGGLIGGSTTVIIGAPGTAKTLLGLHFLAEGASQGRPALGYSLSEQPRRLVEKARRISLDLQPHLDNGNLILRSQSPLSGSLDQMGNDILDTVEQVGAQRVFIDGIDGFQRVNLQPPRLQRFVTALADELTSRGCSVIFSHELGQVGTSALTLQREQLPATIDNMLAIQYVRVNNKLRRVLNVLKEYDHSQQDTVREFYISDHGIDVAPTGQSAEEILHVEKQRGQREDPSGHTTDDA